MPYIDYAGREQEDAELDAMRTAAVREAPEPSQTSVALLAQLLRDLAARVDALTKEVEALGDDVGVLDEALGTHTADSGRALRRDLDGLDQRIGLAESALWAHTRDHGHAR